LLAYGFRDCHERRLLPNIDSARLLRGRALLLLRDLLLGLLGVRNLGDRLVGVVALVAGLIFVTTAFEALDEGSSLVILGILDLLLAVRRHRQDFFLVFIVRLRRYLCLLGLGGGLLSSLCRISLLLLRLLVCGLLGSGSGRLVILLVTEEVGSTLARLDLASRFAIGLGSGLGLGIF
jgi:hypothetical protein